ncbi:hypothetical protein ALQ48_01890 [Pseudomonas coronafaciens pv. zizaniae]|uniref:DUF3892 domain-containing protein n=1 Tax=Pseudomonas syringae TaxID=317 RepID=UPI0006D5D12A|nr:DUF3892 domain-containing protein [Pseudomonas syringae]RMO09250.1 hypothetical protein ALQ48_01890 [Pseudomonas coronafaciens pv. zizaniae]SDX04295.1 Protein of unknown function [Pseudomonas syringae]SFM16766.1 Protein of unknown function [Pseudomonas syringae]
MTDYCISAVSYDSQGSHIQWVRVHKDLGTSVGEGMVCAREFVADLISSNKATFQTIVPGVSIKWKDGSRIHVIDKVYLTTDSNSTKRDNLGSLETF